MFIISSLKQRLQHVAELKSISLFRWSSLHSYFCYKFGVAGNSKLNPEVWDDLFNTLLFLRLNKSNNLELSTKLELYLSTISIPKGVQQMFLYLPVSGSFYNYKGIPFKLELCDEVVRFVEDRAHSNVLYSNLSQLNRQLRASKSGRFEKFDLIRFNSQVKNFILNSVYIGVEDSNLTSYCLSLNNVDAVLSKSIAITLVFSLNIAKRYSDAFLYIIGSVCEATIERDSLVVNVQSALELLLPEDSGKPDSVIDKTHSEEVSSNNDSTGSVSRIGSARLQTSSIKLSNLLLDISSQIKNINNNLQELNKSKNSFGLNS